MCIRDRLQHHEIADLGAAHLAGGADALGEDVATVGEHADHFLEAGEQVAGSLEVDVGRAEFRVEADHPVRRGVEHLAQLELHIGLSLIHI